VHSQLHINFTVLYLSNICKEMQKCGILTRKSLPFPVLRPKHLTRGSALDVAGGTAPTTQNIHPNTSLSPKPMVGA